MPLERSAQMIQNENPENQAGTQNNEIEGWKQNGQRPKSRKIGWLLVGVLCIVIGIGVAVGIAPSRDSNTEDKLGIKEEAEIVLLGKNGSIIIKGYEGDHIKVQVRSVPNAKGTKKMDGSIPLIQKDNKFYLDYDQAEYKSVSIEAWIPQKTYHSIKAQSSNGTIDIKRVAAEGISLQSSNARIIAEGLKSSELDIQTSNARVNLEDIVADEVKLKTSNGSVHMKAVDSSIQKISTSNSSVQVGMKEKNFTRFQKYDINIKTSNGSIQVNTPINDSIGYRVKAQTSNGNISADLGKMNISKKDKKRLEAITENFERAQTQIEFTVDTSNSSIHIN